MVKRPAIISITHPHQNVSPKELALCLSSQLPTPAFRAVFGNQSLLKAFFSVAR